MVNFFSSSENAYKFEFISLKYLLNVIKKEEYTIRS